MPKDSWIAYVGPFSFPWGQAGSRRIYGIARSLAEAGYKVIIGSGDSLPTVETDLGEGEKKGNVRYIGLGESPAKNASVVQKSFQVFWAWGVRTVAWLNSLPSKPSHVIAYGGSAQYMFRLLPWCQRNRIPLIADVVEWYNPRHMGGGIFGPFNISDKIALHFQYPKCDGVIAISSYLTKHFRSHGCPVVCIPPTLDVSRIPFHPNDQRGNKSKLTLAYAGTPGKKDLLCNIIRGITKIDPRGEHVTLLVMGPSLEQVKQLLSGTNPPASVHVIGQVSQVDIPKFIQQADFSVLLREPLRFAQAGFPTKFVESLANGTPVIANITSDLGSYLHEGIEGLICRDHSADAFAETLRRAFLLTPAHRQEMRHAARRQAERSFDFRNYTEALSTFFGEVSC
jgi:glycosyltransferase involved in cell wall biosynthesis